MEKNLSKLKNLCEFCNISAGKINDEYLFTLNAVDILYYNKNIGQIDITDGFVDGPNDGGIDYIFNKDDVMYLVQGKSSNSLSVEDIKNVFNKICDTIENFENDKSSRYSNKLQSTYLNKYDDLSDDKNIQIVLFTNTKITEDMKAKIDDFIYSKRMSNYIVKIYDGSDIENIFFESNQLDEFVENYSVELFDIRNYLTYKEGMIVNIKASSLRTLYKQYSQKGLFNFNLREHISQKNVDNAIDDTIKNDPENFWFYNNGITIGCVDYYLDGNTIKLEKFSIINGAQTTTKIGNSSFDSKHNDFPIVCKIVKAKGSLKESQLFINKISEASNSQKPIRPRDLKANAVEQRKLQSLCMNNKHQLFIEIKRGVKPISNNSINKWQKISNEYLGQLILSCILQRPGTARSGKASIFTSEKTYNKVYRRNHDANTLYDLVRIANIYDEFKIHYINEKEEDLDLIGICQNGKLTILAIVFYLYKFFNNIVEGYNDPYVLEDNIKGDLTLKYLEDDYENKLYSFFELIIQLLSDIYKNHRNDNNSKATSYSNFFKTDKTYIDTILKDLDTILKREYIKKEICNYISIFN